MRRRGLYLTEQFNFIALNTEIPCYTLTSVSTLTYTTNYFADKTVTNEGTAIVTKYDNYVEFSIGTIFGIKIYQGATLVNELPCIESNIDVPYLHDMITGNILFNLSGTKILSTQNNYDEVMKYGWQEVVITEDAKTILVSRLTNKQKIYL